MTFPTSQSQLIRLARGERSQAEFAQLLGVDRSCLSRYEREILGAPPSVITYCLSALSRQTQGITGTGTPLEQALERARELVAALERANPAKPASGQRKPVRSGS